MLTIQQIKELKPSAKRRMVRDGSGLYLEMQPTGALSWVFRYTLRRRAGKLCLGRFPQISVTDARKRRDLLRNGIREGKSPADQRREEKQAEMRGLTVKAFALRYIAEHLSRKRKNTEAILRYFERDIFPVIGDRPITSIHPEDLRPVIMAKVSEKHEQAALAIRNLLKRLFDYAIVFEVVTVNPLAAIPAKFVATPNSRTRALNQNEIFIFLNVLERAHMRRSLKAALRLILLTLVRKSELRLARWEHIDLAKGEWEIPQENSKTDAAQIVYLSRQAHELLTQHFFWTSKKRFPEPREFIFTAIGGQFEPMSASTLNRALDRLPLKIQHFTVHDLRRTAATCLAEQEYSADWIEKALNHKIKGVRGVYNRAQYATQRRTMLQAWADWLDEVKG